MSVYNGLATFPKDFEHTFKNVLPFELESKESHLWKDACWELTQGWEKTADLLFIADFVAEFSIHFMLI